MQVLQVTIIGYSGGGAIALFICEALPKDVKVDRVILLGAAVSPGYGLRPALEHCRCGIANYYSEGDWFDAGFLTVLFGTMDGKKTSTAGRLGFLDQSGQSTVLSGLRQTAWAPAWRSLGHNGGHYGWGAHAWAREVLAPLIRADAADAVRLTGQIDRSPASSARINTTRPEIR